NGILITRSLEHFGARLERFPGAREFVALVEPADDSASRLLKTLENPKHDGFSSHRITDQVKRRKADVAMKTLADEVRKAIREHAAITEASEVVLDELSHLF